MQIDSDLQHNIETLKKNWGKMTISYFIRFLLETADRGRACCILTV